MVQSLMTAAIDIYPDKSGKSRVRDLNSLLQKYTCLLMFENVRLSLTSFSKILSE